MARWITVNKVPFDYKWPTVTAITAFTEVGEFYVKDEVADYAVAKGYATDGKAEDAVSEGHRARPRKKATQPAKTAKVAVDAIAPDTREPAGVDRTDLAADGGADDSATLADAG